MLLAKTALFLLSGSTALFGSYALESEAYSRAYGPKNNTLTARPTLRWEVWPGPGGSVTSKKMTVNGKDVEAVYSEKERALVYTPRTAFAAGTYKVQCRVVIDGSLVANKDWSFTISSGASNELPAADDEQHRAVRAANSYRQALGLDDFQMDSRLNAASLAHSKYLSTNNTTGHYQKEGTPGYFGNTPGERLESFGFLNESWECVDYGNTAPEQSVRSLFDAPYHRIPFLQPGPLPVGAGYFDRRLTMEFGGAAESGTVVYPVPGQTGVPIQWNANERPNPIRMHTGVRLPVGYVIVFTHWEKGGCGIEVEEATLRSSQDGSAVPVLLNTPENDPQLDNVCFLIPAKPLKPGVSYSAYVRARVKPARGKEGVVEKRWQFITAGVSGAAPRG